MGEEKPESIYTHTRTHRHTEYTLEKSKGEEGKRRERERKYLQRRKFVSDNKRINAT